MSLTPSQETALNGLVKWYYGQQNKAILEGGAGKGKTYLINMLLERLGKNIRPLLLADTNEAVNVLRYATKGAYDSATICSALGLVLTHDKDAQTLTKKSDPDLSKYNLIIVDEASMPDDMKLDYLEKTDKYILYSGHKSQLPPVQENQSLSDPCLSPVFLRNYPTFSLIEPVRNTGEIYEFCQTAEKLIYQRGILPFKFKTTQDKLVEYLKKSKDSLVNNQTVFLAYTNERVGQLNAMARYFIFGNNRELFYPSDKVIFRSPTAVFQNPLKQGYINLNQILRQANEYKIASTNSRGTVLKVNYVTLMGISCYELLVEIDTYLEKYKGYVYVAMDEKEKNELRSKLYYSALYERKEAAAKKKWDSYHNMTLLFSNTKHSYSLTVHCSQGSTINSVIVDESDIDRCQNQTLRKKLKYVAFSRASNNLFRV